MTKENFDCPHCGQDLRLSPDAKDEITLAVEKAHELIGRLVADLAFIDDHICNEDAVDANLIVKTARRTVTEARAWLEKGK